MKIPERRQQLLALKARLAQEYAAKVSIEPPAEDLDLLERRLARVGRALDAFVPDYWVRLRPVMGVGLFIAITATTLLVWRATFLPVVLDISASAVSLEMRAAARIENVRFDGSAELRGVDWIASPRAAALAASDQSIGVAELSATWLRLDELHIPGGATLDLQVNGGNLTAIITGNDAMESSFQLKGDTRVATQSGELVLALSEPEAFRFGMDAPADSHGAELRTLEINGHLVKDGEFAFNVDPASLRFVERVSDSLRGEEFASSVIEGTISIPAMQRTQTLELGEVIDIDDLSSEIARVTVGDRVHIRLRGAAGDIRVGSKEFAHRVAPTMLEYLARNHVLTLLWGLAGTAGGLLWSIVRFFRS